MSQHPKPHFLRTTFTSIAIIGIGALAIAYFASGGVPKAFFAARLQAAGAANNVAVLINNSLANLSRIEQFEQNNSNAQALELLSFEIGQKQEKQNAATLLAGELESMAKAAMEISSGGARGLAIEAVTTGVSMVSRIINYNNSLDQLFASIQEKIETGSTPAGVNIRALLASINSDGQSINVLNNSFNSTLQRFDKSYGAN